MTMQPRRFQILRLRVGQCRASGFTLLELLIALGLGILLVGSIGASLLIYMQTEQSGREKLERAQVARGIFFWISNDLRSVVFREEIKEASDAEEVTAAEDELEVGNDELVEFLTPELAYGSTTVGLYGNTETLVVNIARPRRINPRAASSSVGESPESVMSGKVSYAGSGLRSVFWFLAAGETGGLARSEGESLRVLYDPVGFETEGMSSDPEIVASEVISLGFRYFDGVDWADEWDSTAQERLPNAVEVTIGFAGRSTASNEYLDDVDNDSTNSMRFVINLSLAPPPLSEVEI